MGDNATLFDVEMWIKKNGQDKWPWSLGISSRDATYSRWIDSDDDINSGRVLILSKC